MVFLTNKKKPMMLRSEKRALFSLILRAVLICVLVAPAAFAASKPPKKTAATQINLTPEETQTLLTTMGIAKDAPTFVKSADTSEKPWRAYLFTVPNGTVNMPLLVYVNGNELVVGLLIKNGKLIMPKIPVEEMQPAINMSETKLSSEKRKVYNPRAKETLYMFTDPDCPYCKEAEAKLLQYHGRYKVVMKHFPIDQLHPGATDRAVEKQCNWTNKVCDAAARQTAAQIVAEDIREASALGVNATPLFLTARGNVLNAIPDLTSGQQITAKPQ